MEDLIQIKYIILLEKEGKLIYYNGSVASRFERGNDVNRLLEMLESFEGNDNAAHSTLQTGDYLDNWLRNRIENVVSRLQSFGQDDQIKAKAKVFEEESEENPENTVLEGFFELLKEEVSIIEKDTTLSEQILAKNQAVEVKEQPQKEWTLFRKRAFFDEEKEFINNKILLEIATELYEKYHHDPAHLENVAALFSLKYTVKEWEDRLDNVLRSVRDASKTNLFNMKLSSYEKLQPDIQKCVCYCSLFPKDYMFNETDLIHLWASQEQFLNTAANPESVGKEYFGKLLKEGYFFEIIQRGGIGNIVGYKMHYLVNEFLEEIAKPEFCLVDVKSPGEIDVDNILHLSFVVDSSWKPPSWISTAKRLRSLLFLPNTIYENLDDVSFMDEIFRSCTNLRALDMVAVNCESIMMSSLRELKDLRYLRVGFLGKLPESITRLENLQTLDLRYSSVMEMPQNVHTLRHLRHLYVGSTLIDMPPQIRELDSLYILDEFVVGENNGLDVLDCLKLVGKLTVRFEKKNFHHEALKNNNSITDLSLIWSPSYGGQTTGDDTQHFLQPPANLESLAICGWKEERFSNFSILKKLVSLCVKDCNNCKNLPNLSGLPYLRFLQLWDLNALKYIEDDDDHIEASDLYFPSLTYVMLANLQELKGWSSREQEKEIHSNYLQLTIKGCPKMMSIPRIPKLESLEANNIHEKLLNFLLSTSFEAQNSCINLWRRVSIPLFKPRQSSYSGWIQLGPSSSSLPPPISKLQNLEIVSVNQLDTTLSFSNITKSLTIRQCPKLKKLDFKLNMNSLQEFVIHDCSGLQDIASAAHLSALQKLEIKHCKNLNLGEDSMLVAWEGLQSLHTLKLVDISNLMSLEKGLIALRRLEVLSLHSFYELKTLPEWIGKLTRLHQLAIQNCPYLITLPESLGNLSALQQLEIQCCPLLKQIPKSFARLNSLKHIKIQQCPKLIEWCQNTAGQDYPHIQHIPDFFVLE